MEAMRQQDKSEGDIAGVGGWGVGQELKYSHMLGTRMVNTLCDGFSPGVSEKLLRMIPRCLAASIKTRLANMTINTGYADGTRCRQPPAITILPFGRSGIKYGEGYYKSKPPLQYDGRHDPGAGQQHDSESRGVGTREKSKCHTNICQEREL